MPIDWTATGSMISGLATASGAGAVVYAANKGTDTFKQWRKQKHHERCMSVAEEILTIAYKIKRAFEGIRSPGIFGGEVADLTQKLKDAGLVEVDSTEPSQMLVTAQAALTRTDYHRTLFDTLLDKIPVAKAVFGDEVADQMDVFWSQRVKLVIAAQAYVRESRRRDPEGTTARTQQQERIERLESTLWSGGGLDDVDQFAVDVDSTILNLERNLLPIIRNAE